jgi:hypothetical protein
VVSILNDYEDHYQPFVGGRLQGIERQYQIMIELARKYQLARIREMAGETREYESPMDQFQALLKMKDELWPILIALKRLKADLPRLFQSPSLEDFIHMDRLREIELWIEAEMDQLIERVEANPPEGYQRGRLAKYAAFKFGYDPSHYDPQRTWDREVYYWRKFGGIEGHGRIILRATEHRYEAFWKRIQYTRLGRILPRRLDLE